MPFTLLTIILVAPPPSGRALAELEPNARDLCYLLPACSPPPAPASPSSSSIPPPLDSRGLSSMTWARIDREAADKERLLKHKR